MSESKNPIQVADRLFGILEILAETGSIGLLELSSRMKLHKSTVHRVLSSLIYMGYVKQDADTGKYSLTYKILEVSNQMMNKVSVLEIARPYLKKLMEKTGETVHFVQLEGNEAVYIDKVEAHMNSIRMVSRVGSRIPFYCSGVGKALAAFMEEEQVKYLWENSQIVAKTNYTTVDYNKFINILIAIKRQGYALDNEENELGVRCVAAALLDKKGNPKYAFSISAPIHRMSDARIKELSAFVLETKRQMQEEIQYI